MRLISAALGALLLGACAVTPAGERMASNDESEDEDVICTNERTLGSNIGTRVCRSRAEMETQEAMDQQVRDRMRGAGPQERAAPIPNTGGGLPSPGGR